MAKINFLRNERYKGVTYEVCPKSNYNSHWKNKHQVPDITKLPNDTIHWSYMRFPYKYSYLPDNSGGRYSFVDIMSLNIGDVIKYFGSYKGVISDIRVDGGIEYGFYITIEFNKTFEIINNELILLDKVSTYKITMSNFMCFFDNLYIADISKIKYKTTLDLIPYYQNLLNKQKEEINFLKAKNKEYESTLNNLDKRISDITYKTISEREQRSMPVIREKTKKEKEYDERIRSQVDMESTHRVAEGLRKLAQERDLYDSMPWLDRFGGTRP